MNHLKYAVLALVLASCATQSRFEILTRDAQGYALVYDRQSKKFLVVNPAGTVTEQQNPPPTQNPTGK